MKKAQRDGDHEDDDDDDDDAANMFTLSNSRVDVVDGPRAFCANVADALLKPVHHVAVQVLNDGPIECKIISLSTTDPVLRNHARRLLRIRI